MPLFFKALIDNALNENMEDYTLSLFNKYKDNLEIKLLLSRIINIPKIPIELLSKYYAKLYTIESRFYKDLNKNLILNKKEEYLPYIKTLYKGVKLKSLSLSSDKELYRGSSMNKEEINKIKNNLENKIKGLPGLIAFCKPFLSFTKDKKVAFNFLESKKEKNLFKVLFILEKDDSINYNLSTHCDLENISYYPSEKEVLFFPFSSFEIKELNDVYLGKEKIYELHLLYSGKYLNDIENNTYLNKEENKIPDSEFKKELIEIGLIDKDKFENLNCKGLLSKFKNYFNESNKEINKEKNELNNKSSDNNDKINDNKAEILNQNNSDKNSKFTDNNFDKKNINEQNYGNIKKEVSKSKDEKNENEKDNKYNINEELQKIEENKNIDKLENKNINIQADLNLDIKIFDYNEKEIEEKSIDYINNNNIETEKETKNKKKINIEDINKKKYKDINKLETNGQESLSSSIDKDNKMNKIIGEINIFSEDISKDIRIINSFENCNKSNNNISDEDQLNYKNEEEIKKNIKIKINGETIRFSYFYNFYKIGKYKIEYIFQKDLTKINHMFYGCSKLSELNLSNFNTQNVTNMSYMFDGCVSLKNLI